MLEIYVNDGTVYEVETADLSESAIVAARVIEKGWVHEVQPSTVWDVIPPHRIVKVRFKA